MKHVADVRAKRPLEDFFLCNPYDVLSRKVQREVWNYDEEMNRF